MDIANYTKINKYGLSFYTNRNTARKVMETLMERCGPEQCLVAHVRDYEAKGKKEGEMVKKKYCQYAIVECSKLEDLLKDDKGLFEVMHPDRMMKLMFDIDYTGMNDPIGKVKKRIRSILPNASMNISGSVGEKGDTLKFSYHIVVNNYHVLNVGELDPIKQFCAMYKELGFDMNIYRANGLMKYVNQSKGDGRVQEIIEGSDNILDHTIMHGIPKDSIHVKNVSELQNFLSPGAPALRKRKRENDEGSVQARKGRYYPGQIPRMNLEPPETLDIYRGDPLHFLAHMPNPKRGDTFELSNWLCSEIGRWCKMAGITFASFWEWNSKKDSTPQRKAKYIDYWNRVDVQSKPISENFMKACLVAVYNGNILKSTPYKVMENAINKEFNHRIDSRWLSSADLHLGDDYKHIVLHVSLGGNKSGSTIDYLKELLEGDKELTALWGTCRIALTNEQRGRMEKTGVTQWKYYLDYRPDEKQNPVHHPYLVCSIQSIYLARGVYDIIVIDECETFLRSFADDAKCHGNPSQHWNNFMRLLASAKKVIWMDGFLTRATTDLIRDIGGESFIIGSSVPPPQREIKYCQEIEDLYAKMFNSLDKGEKIFIASGAKGSRKVHSAFDGVENIVSTLMAKYKWKRGTEIIGIHADRKKDKENLRNIEEVWGNPAVRVVVGNAALAVGVNYDVKEGMRPFDRVFGIFNPACISYRDFFQLLARIRRPLSNEIWILFTEPFMKAVKQDRLIVSQSDGFRTLAAHMDSESFADKHHKSAQDLFKLYADLCNIKLCSKTCFALEKDARHLISACFDSRFNMFSWHNIKDISGEECERLERLIEALQADVDQILQVKKFRFRNLFRSVVTENLVEIYWDTYRDTVYAVNNFGRLERGQELYHDIKCAPIVHKFYKDNNLTIEGEIRPEHVCNSPFEDIQRSFKMFHRPKTYRMDLYAKIINAYFCAPIIVKTKEKRKNKKRYTWDTNGLLLGKIAEALLSFEEFDILNCD
ncbi:uncharacterized protein EV422DRAFT_508001 [Fimicolochytrium jonesii]|uniref:uncharacterized protein n=1 Tax=Fimicolochytrium jonesii TaxID=1396493 RepID=UPI0022FEDB88|nr:uncharacterized protein EV422DRAFT_508001 [Fimicolochytrium jonesii]KAI8818847.1 hypothetical protein EV422DRAFT_508001 [Fimicolochytrium jonesii]